jgi:hypothetical protein
VHVAELGHRGVRGREGEPAAVQPGSQQLLEARLENWRLPSVEPSHPLSIDISAQNLEARCGRAGRVCDAEVSGPQHRQARAICYEPVSRPWPAELV